MADFQYRDKLRKIEQAASTNEVPNSAKNFGLGCFTLGMLLFIGFLLFLAISLFIHHIIIGSVITFIVAALFIFILIKLLTAPKLP
ncbi:hypothetical protein [Psychrobacillus sp. OK032]|uniref:hypothetical protein n=1 Tax=Psychrobacillus sp. OK032 TaxID=1884358 RepID=UPI0008AE2FCF|nr:hypothetical protein [Psychrobacillus sp. OK032]SES02356.1 hypothetical protein SAMN05518872_103255 [Psychrobacillus sp. OK032]